MITRTRLQIIKYVDKKWHWSESVDRRFHCHKQKEIYWIGWQATNDHSNKLLLIRGSFKLRYVQRAQQSPNMRYTFTFRALNGFLIHLSLPTCRRSCLRICTPQRRTNIYIYIYTVPWGIVHR